MSDFSDVLDFHERFDLPRGKMPTAMVEESFKFRLGFLREEAGEFDQATEEKNLVGAVDALCDFVYVAIGTALFLGCPRDSYEIYVRDWPNFHGVKNSAMTYRLLDQSKNGPRLLTPGMLDYAMQSMISSINGFKMAYDEGVHHESQSAFYLALHSLKRCANKAYSIAALMNVPWDQCWRHVQVANMSKERAKSDGSNSKRFSPFDVVKPTGWVAPEAKIAMELQLSGWRVPDMMLIDNAKGKVRMLDGLDATS